MFLSFGENLLWQYKDPSPDQFLGRLGRIGSEGTLSLSNAFPEYFIEGNIVSSIPKYSRGTEISRNFRVLHRASVRYRPCTELFLHVCL